MFLILVDAHSQWMEVCPVTSATSQVTIDRLRMIFATHGLPQILVSDNGTCFTSAEFQEFVRKNGIRHVTSSPYHPASNGLAERAVQSFKVGMKKAGTGNIETNLARFLFRYRIIPHTTTGRSPAELLMGT
jgi:transposase InsO family protein